MLNTESSTGIKDTKDQFQLVELTLEQVSQDWDAIWEGIDSALPPLADGKDPNRRDRILSAIMDGRLKCWIFSIGDEPYVLATFTVSIDNMTGTKNLCLYTLYGYQPIDYKLWNLLLSRVRKHAKELGCYQIIAYSSLPRVMDLVKVLGGDSSYHLITLEV